MKNKKVATASLGKLIFGAAVLGVVLIACLALLFAWILRAPIGQERAEITVTMPFTGGLFEGSAATYRGVNIGEVTHIDLDNKGVRATVRLKAGAKVPRQVEAKVRSLSPVGEQYVDFRPTSAEGPYLRSGDVVAADAKDLPVSLAKMVTGLQAAMRQVDPDKVRTVLKELNIAFAGSGDDLDALLTNTETILETLDTSWPQVENILKDGKTSLEMFADNRETLVSFAASAATVGTWFIDWNPDLVKVLKTMPADLTNLMVLIDGVDRRLPGVLKDLNPLSRFLALRGPHLQATLEMTPYGFGRFASVMYNGYMNVTANINGQKTCDYGVKKNDPMSGPDKRQTLTDGHCGEFPWRGANHAPPALSR
ncbi:phospholipid/cholesterol/gamma-HCH transport system substrate-binding protein [Nocardioides daedukensis]|uniref:Phospholipid/cholesterol/gamma-HCH transport system substrate-binding protein n=1 Tax=Nocardioides daedukensis TaxID=634462 RepID=A0A7Y9UMS0_9ACTN|nr:MlaD family protein [Nocardioides daedukensis]NYG57793.1 phospholipid/cholesterol/gamma-HCH transport system substrate-binding protein [Nocardioides daedukensis]